MSGGGGSFFSQATRPVGTLMSNLTGASDTANAMQNAANSQLSQEQADRQQALAYANNPQELAQLQDAIATNKQDIARKQKLLDSADPALIEAGNQALQLMQGKNAASLGPLQNQIANQRQQMQAKLARQLGPDWASSSAGMQAMGAFDQNAQNALNAAQQQSLSTYLGTAQNAAQLGNLQNNISNSAGFANQYGNIANRQISALQGNRINANLQNTGELANAQNDQIWRGKFVQTGLGKLGPFNPFQGQSASSMFSEVGKGGAAPAPAQPMAYGGMVQRMSDGGEVEDKGGMDMSQIMGTIMQLAPIVLGGMPMKSGGLVPGEAKVKGDSSKNDTVPVLLSPGEIVLKRSIVNSKNAPMRAKHFVERELAKQGKSRA